MYIYTYTCAYVHIYGKYILLISLIINKIHVYGKVENKSWYKKF